MLKRIALGTVLTGLVGVLIFGAVTRTNAVAGSSGGHGQGQRAAGQVAERGRQALQAGRAAGSRVGQVAAGEWVTLEGTVVSVTGDEMIVDTSNGQTATVEGQPWRFAQEQGFAAKVGDKVTLTGFYEDGEFKAGQITNQTDGKQVALRDTGGRPGWAGRGRRS